MLRQLRKNKTLNALVRSSIRRFGKGTQQFYKAVNSRWTTSGIIPCSFESYDFIMYNECDDGLVNYFYYDNFFKGAENLLKNQSPVILFECFLNEERKYFFDEILKKFGYTVYLVMKEGIVRDDSFNRTDGLNYLLSPKRLETVFTEYRILEAHPDILFS